MLSLLKSFPSSETINTCLYFHRLSCKFCSRWKWCCYVNRIKLSKKEDNPAGSMLSYECTSLTMNYIQMQEFTTHFSVVSFDNHLITSLKVHRQNFQDTLMDTLKCKRLFFSRSSFIFRPRPSNETAIIVCLDVKSSWKMCWRWKSLKQGFRWKKLSLLTVLSRVSECPFPGGL